MFSNWFVGRGFYISEYLFECIDGWDLVKED